MMESRQSVKSYELGTFFYFIHEHTRTYQRGQWDGKVVMCGQKLCCVVFPDNEHFLILSLALLATTS